MVRYLWKSQMMAGVSHQRFLPVCSSPLVTSGRSQGDKGLGLYRVFNWLTHLLHGDVQCESDVLSKTKTARTEHA